MAGGYGAPTGDDYSILVTELRQLADRLSELEIPTGTSVNSLVEQVQLAIADIDTTVNAAIAANSMTTPAIVALVASPGAIAPTTVTASGNVSIGGQVACLDAYNTDITWTRKTMWVGNDGRFGYASSSVDKKTDLKPVAIDVDAFLGLPVSSFFYRAEIARRTQLRIDGIVPDYQPPREVGLMAQDVAAVPSLEWLTYRDVHGNPDGIEYSMLGIPLLVAAQRQEADIVALRSEVAELRALITGKK